MPLAGKPPYATDLPDSYYDQPTNTQRRVRQDAPADPNKRTSAYNTYDNYLTDNGNAEENRQSGVGALGMGLLSGDMDDDDSEDEDDRPRPSQVGSKNAALAAATGANPPQLSNQQPPLQPIAAPRPGYAAPIAALNLARPEPTATPQGRRPLENPFEPSTQSQPHLPPASPSHIGAGPHPLQAPITPITPVFARPAKNAIKFEATPRTPKPIMRGNSEETLLPKRGEKGDDFWRRFSMIAKEPAATKESSWLKKTQSGTSRLSRWVWIIGMCLLIAIGAAAGLGYYFTRNKPDHQPPKVFGGSADEAPITDTNVIQPATTAPDTGAGATRSFHVTPTHTVARRNVDPSPSVFPLLMGPTRQVKVNFSHKKRRMQWLD